MCTIIRVSKRRMLCHPIIQWRLVPRFQWVRLPEVFLTLMARPALEALRKCPQPQSRSCRHPWSRVIRIEAPVLHLMTSNRLNMETQSGAIHIKTLTKTPFHSVIVARVVAIRELIKLKDHKQQLVRQGQRVRQVITVTCLGHETKMEVGATRLSAPKI
jgi:hypothetical protein